MNPNKDALQEYFHPIISNVDSQSLMEDTFRLDGQYYVLFDLNADSITSSSFLDLDDCCKELYEVPPFKHIYVSDGVPFYTSSGLFDNEFIPSHYLTPIMPNIDRYRIKKGQILMARSGNVASGILGQIMIAGESLDKTTTSDHVIRFSVDENKIHKGYLAAFLMSNFCKGQLLKNASGAVIPAIRPDSIRGLQIPIIEEIEQNKIGTKILKAVEKREDAVFKIKQARSLVVQYNNLPPLFEITPKTLDADGEVEIRMTGMDEFTKDYRLDAHFYNPIAKVIVENIITNCPNYDNLYEIADCSFRGSRSTRNYVDKENGLAFLSGKNIIQIRPDFKYISTSETANISDMLLTEGQILISRSGTLGRTVLIYKNYESFAASEHLIRVKPDTKIIDSGYLYAFLSSDYGYHQLLKYKHGSVIDEITEDQISQSVIPLPTKGQQKEIGDLVRKAYELRAEAIKLEDEAQELLTQALTQA